MGVGHVHEATAGTVQHVHHDGHEDHAKAGHHGDMHGSGKQLADSQVPPAGDGHKAPGAQCCGMICISALPASTTEFVGPSAPTSRCVFETYRSVAGKAPPTLYRPPIS